MKTLHCQLKNMFIVLLFLPVLAISQLSGSYTIGSGGDYTSIDDAVSALISNGISSAVTFTILPGTYSGQVVIPFIAGVNSENRITFQGTPGDPTAVRLEFDATGLDDNYIIKLQAASYIEFKHLFFKSLDTRYAAGIVLEGVTHHILVDSVKFQGVYPDQNSYETNSGIYCIDGTLNAISIQNCEFDSLSSGIALVASQVGDGVSDLTIQHNRFYDVGYYGMQIRYGNHVIIDHNNLVIKSNGISVQGGGMVTITNNEIHSQGYGLNLGNLSSSFDSPSQIANNVLDIGPNAISGIRIASCDYLNLIFNTMQFEDQGYHFSDAGLSITYSNQIRILNNNLINTLRGFVLFVDESSTITECDYNNFFSFAPVFAWWEEAVVSIEELQQASSMNEHCLSIFMDFEEDQMTPLTAWLDNAGIPVSGVTTDFNGNPRNDFSPDIGAIEFTAPPDASPPLSGNIYVGPGRNYETISDAAADLFLKGIDDSVNVYLTSGTFEEQVTWLPIPGISSEHNVLISSETNNPLDVTVQYAMNEDSNFIFKFQALPYVTVQGITFETIDAANGGLIRCEGYLGDITFLNNIFNGIEWTGSNAEKIIFQADYSYYAHLVFESNSFFGGSTVLYLNQDANYRTPDQLRLTSNHFTGTAYQLVQLRNAHSVIADGNISMESVLGLHLSTVLDSTIIKKNKIHVTNGYALRLSGIDSHSDSPSRITNNFFSFGGTVPSANLISMAQCDTLWFTNNNISFSSTRMDRNPIYVSGGTDYHFLNNVIYNSGTSYTFYSPISSMLSEMDYNCLFTSGSDLAYVGQTCANLSDLQIATGDNQHSLVANPGYTDTDDLHVSSPSLNATGLPLPFIMVDIDNQYRHPLTPDIGADEFTVGPNNPPIIVQPIADLHVDEDTGPWEASQDITSVFSDSDPGDYLFYSIRGNNSSIFSNIQNNILSVNSADNYFGTGELYVTATDLSGAAVTDTFLVIIDSIPDSPVAMADTIQLMSGDSTQIAVLENDYDPDGEIPTILSVGTPTHGLVRWTSGEDMITYVSSDVSEENDWFSYIIADHTGLTDTTTVTVEISEILSLSDSFPGISNSIVRWLDTDNDKDLDLLIAGETDNTQSGFITRIYLNQNGHFTSGQQFPGLRPMNPQGAAVVDIDNDDDMDFIIQGALNGTGVPSTVLYLNNGDGFYSAHNGIFSGAFGGFILSEDMDSDGDYDILISGFSDAMMSQRFTLLYLNEGVDQSGVPVFSINESTGLPDLALSSAAILDLDHDSDPDLAICGEDNFGGKTFDLYLQEDGVFSPMGLDLPGISSGTLQWTDVNGDGNQDLLYSGATGDILFATTSGTLINNGGLNFNHNSDPFQPLGMSSLDAVDMDLDGDPDIALLGRDSSLAKYTFIFLTQENSFIELPLSLIDLSNGSLQWGDYDNDGDADLIISGIDNDGDRHTYLYTNINSTSNTVPTRPMLSSTFSGDSLVGFRWHRSMDDHTPESVITYNVIVSDETNDQNIRSSNSHLEDGTLKISYSGNVRSDTSFTLKNSIPGKLYYFFVQAVDGSRKAGPFSSLFGAAPLNEYFMERHSGLTGISSPSLTTCDFDLDGLFELALMGHTEGYNYISEFYDVYNTSYINMSVIQLPYLQYPFMSWQDINGDDLGDLLVTGFDTEGVLYYYTGLYFSQGNTLVESEMELPGMFKAHGDWADFDNDGDPDLLLQGVTVTTPQLKILINNDSTFVEHPQQFTGMYSGNVQWGDIDADGDMDFISCGITNEPPLYYATQLYINESGFFTLHENDLPAIRNGMIKMADYDSDGDLDLFITGEYFDGQSWGPLTELYRNDNMNFIKTLDLFVPVQDSKVIWADMDNDGDLDIMYAGRKKDGQVYENVACYYIYGAGGYHYIDTWLGPVSNSDMTLTEVDDDGKLDFLIAGMENPDDYDTHLFRNRTSNINQPPSTPGNPEFIQTDSSIIFMWNPSTDDHTSTNALTYNLKIGTSSGLSDIKPCNSDSTGKRLVLIPGNVGQVTSWELKNPPLAGVLYWQVQAIDNSFAGSPFTEEQSIIITDIVRGNENLPDHYGLNQNYPNPFNPITTIQYQLPQPTQVTLTIFNALGQRITTLVDKKQDAGYYKIKWEADHLPNGIYFYELQAGKAFKQTKKMILIK